MYSLRVAAGGFSCCASHWAAVQSGIRAGLRGADVRACEGLPEMAYLAIYVIGRDDQACCRHELTRAVTIGRALDCDLPFGTDDGLSRRHCTITPTDSAKESWVVIDHKSSNGTRVGATYVDRQVLRDGDEVFAGRLRIVFHAIGYVPKRPDQPEPDSPVLEELRARAALTGMPADGPRPQPRATVRPIEAIPDAQTILSLSDTAPLPRHSVPFERPAARPILAPGMLPRQRMLPMRWAAGAIALFAAVAAAAWLIYHY
jgi:hypothetical protein